MANRRSLALDPASLSAAMQQMSVSSPTAAKADKRQNNQTDSPASPAASLSPPSSDGNGTGQKKRRARALSLSIGRLLKTQKDVEKLASPTTSTSSSAAYSPYKSQVDDTQENVFGVHLMFQPYMTDGIPMVVHRTSAYLLDTHAVKLEGVFRLAGSIQEVRRLRSLFDSGEDADLASARNPHSVASLLKLFLRELPDPLCTYEYYDMFISSISEIPEVHRQQSIDRITKVVAFLPTVHRTLLSYLMLFLKEATHYASTSKMDSANLAKIFAPTILRSPTQQVAQEAKDSPSATLLVQLMIDHYDHIFSAYPKLSLAHLSDLNTVGSDDSDSINEADATESPTAAAATTPTATTAAAAAVAVAVPSITLSTDAKSSEGAQIAAGGTDSPSNARRAKRVASARAQAGSATPDASTDATPPLSPRKSRAAKPAASSSSAAASPLVPKKPKKKPSKPRTFAGTEKFASEEVPGVSANELFLEAAQQGDLEAAMKVAGSSSQLNVNYANERGWTALMYAANRRDTAIVAYLLERRAAVDQRNDHGETALYRAATAGDVDCVHRLLAAGANVDIADHNGFSPLLTAAYSGSRDVIELLLDHGVDVNTQDMRTKKTALHLAAFRGHLSSCTLLLERGARTDLIDAYAWSALMFAAHAGHEAIVKLFLDHKVPLHLESIKGQTALSLAQAAGHVGVVSLLSTPKIKKRIKRRASEGAAGSFEE